MHFLSISERVFKTIEVQFNIKDLVPYDDPLIPNTSLIKVSHKDVNAQ